MMKQRILAGLIAFALIFAFRSTAFAERQSGSCGDNATWTYDTETSTLTISGKGIMAYYDEGNRPYEAYADQATAVVIEAGITSTNWGSFKDFTALERVQLSEGLESIGYAAFSGCRELRSITFPSTLKRISDEAFRDCVSLQSVVIPYNVEEVCQAFDKCDGLKEFWVMNPVCKLVHHNGGRAFWGIPKDCMIYCFQDSTAIPRAEEYGYSYSIIAPYCTDAHDWQGHMITKEATCVAEGVDTTFCITCGKTENKSIPKEPHEFFLAWIETEPTCTQTGTGVFSCTGAIWDGCSERRTESIPALGHSYQNGVCTICAATTEGDFSDVSDNAWYAEAVEFAAMNGLFNGVSEDSFDPEGTMTRAMLVTVLWRIDGKAMITSPAHAFEDVHYNSWFSRAIVWANVNGIVNGVGDGCFDPDGKITREQLAVILYRYAGYQGYDTAKRAELTAYPDAARVSDWALDALQWAVAEGLINGSDGSLLPQGNATRAQVATIMMRYIEKIVK